MCFPTRVINHNVDSKEKMPPYRSLRGNFIADKKYHFTLCSKGLFNKSGTTERMSIRTSLVLSSRYQVLSTKQNTPNTLGNSQ